MKLLFVFLFTMCTYIGQSQPNKEIPLTNKSDFKDGFYTELRDFQQNNPTFPLAVIPKLEYQVDKDSNQIFISEQTLAASAQLPTGSLDSVWGICVQGIPYIKITENTNNQAKTHFIRVHVIGKICYYYYKIFVPRRIRMDVYHPYTGVRIGTREVTNREQVLIEKMFLFETGETADFNLENFKKWINEDTRLSKSLEGMKDSEAEGKIFKTLLIYNDRNPVYLK